MIRRVISQIMFVVIGVCLTYIGPSVFAGEVDELAWKKEVTALRDDVRMLRDDVNRLIELLQQRQLDAPTQTVKLTQPVGVSFTGWELTLNQVINIALQNAEPLNKLGVTTMSRFSDDRVLVTARKSNKEPSDLPATVRIVVSNAEDAYWDLWLAHKKLATAREMRDAAQQIWQQERIIAPEHLKDNTVTSTQARNQYFLFRSFVEQALTDLIRKEQGLRQILGLAKTDGRMIIPSDEPWGSKLNVEWDADLWDEAREQVNSADTLAQIALSRSMTAAADVKTVTELYGNRRISLDIVLDSQRRLFDCRDDYHEALVAQGTAVKNVLLRSGTFLEQRRIKVLDESSHVLDGTPSN